MKFVHIAIAALTVSGICIIGCASDVPESEPIEVKTAEATTKPQSAEACGDCVQQNCEPGQHWDCDPCPTGGWINGSCR